ncbi:response regulator transcription factor [Leifsonia sp. 22587]|uniref:helix-turn-helix transcriptional regulator n=1 Tax=Leifsonia sp. 22587 TaxID=3453946 RepID=UPI003F83E34B
MRDLGALLALPSLWVDHTPAEIADGLLSVVTGMLRLDAAYARFHGFDGGPALESWRPTGAEPPGQLVRAVDGTGAEAPAIDSGIETTAVRAGGSPPEPPLLARMTTLALTLPWGTGLIAVSAARPDFPTERETHLLRVAVGQAAIALHTARRLAAEQNARREAEQALERQSRVLRSLVEEVGPVLGAASRRIEEASREVARDAAREAAHPVDAPNLTRRELEVLGLLAQGLSNKEMAAVMWLSDRTVERHITGLYRKIGVARRSEATAYALRHGIA